MRAVSTSSPLARTSSAASAVTSASTATTMRARTAVARNVVFASASSSPSTPMTSSSTTSTPAKSSPSSSSNMRRASRVVAPAATKGDGASVKTATRRPRASPSKAKKAIAPTTSSTLTSASASTTSTLAASLDAATTLPTNAPAPDGALEIDSVLAAELADNGFRSTRRTKIICTIGPASCSPEVLGELAAGGMNVARLNMCHGSHEWHRGVIASIRKLNKEKGYSVAIMVDTEGSEVHTGELARPLKAEVGAEFTFTVRDVVVNNSDGDDNDESKDKNVIGVSYDAFVDDVEPGDAIVVDGGMVTLEVVSKAGPDVVARVVEPGLVLSRANLTFRRDGSVLRARNAMLPVLSSKDWLDIDFAIAQEVDFIAVSFVKSADVINNLKSYLAARTRGAKKSGSDSGGCASIEVIAKVESFDSVPNLAEIVEASDAVMVARGDLGAQIPMEDVPSVQKEVVTRCRQAGKPVIVASHLLQSMIEYPTPTRAEVADVSDVVRQRADALMLSGESAVGAYPSKAVEVLRAVATHSEEWVRRENYGALVLPQLTEAPDGRASEELCAAAAQLAGNLGARAIFVYTRRGYMANFLSRCRPDCPVFAFTDSQDVRRRLNLRWGVMPFRLDFSADPEENVTRTFALLKRREMVTKGDLVVVVSDIRTLDQASAAAAAQASGRPDDGTGVVRSVQVRRVP